jgi:hypothetical protein
MKENIEEKASKVEIFKRRMLEWSNPVEYVNNMYGCHPGEGGDEYFGTIYKE